VQLDQTKFGSGHAALAGKADAQNRRAVGGGQQRGVQLQRGEGELHLEGPGRIHIIAPAFISPRALVIDHKGVSSSRDGLELEKAEETFRRANLGLVGYRLETGQRIAGVNLGRGSEAGRLHSPADPAIGGSSPSIPDTPSGEVASVL